MFQTPGIIISAVCKVLLFCAVYTALNSFVCP